MKSCRIQRALSWVKEALGKAEINHVPMCFSGKRYSFNRGRKAHQLQIFSSFLWLDIWSMDFLYGSIFADIKLTNTLYTILLNNLSKFNRFNAMSSNKRMKPNITLNYTHTYIVYAGGLQCMPFSNCTASLSQWWKQLPSEQKTLERRAFQWIFLWLFYHFCFFINQTKSLGIIWTTQSWVLPACLTGT